MRLFAGSALYLGLIADPFVHINVHVYNPYDHLLSLKGLTSVRWTGVAVLYLFIVMVSQTMRHMIQTIEMIIFNHLVASYVIESQLSSSTGYDHLVTVWKVDCISDPHLQKNY